MKIAIVDDEVLVRVGIHSLIEWERYGCSILWEADNGTQALEKYQKDRPDLILLDLTMPGISGLEVIRRIRETDEAVTIVVVSCHEEFSMVREALKSGANDYLLKHSLSGESLLNIIKENHLKQGRPEKVQQETQLPEQKAFEHFLKKPEESGMEAAFGKNFEKVLFLTFTALDYERIRERYFHKRAHFFPELIREVAGRILMRFPDCRIAWTEENRFYAMLGCEKNYREFVLLDLGKRLQESMKKFANVELLVGIGNVCEGEGRFVRGVREAEEALGRHFFEWERKLFVWQPYEVQQRQRQFIAKVEQMSGECRQAADGEKEVFSRLLGKYEKEMAAFWEVGAEYYKRIIQLVLGDIFVLSLAEIQWLAGAINEAATIQEVTEIFVLGYEQNQEEFAIRVESDNYLVKQAITYMTEHYQEQITLGALAEYLHVSEGYISRLFKAETRTNIFKYLNQIRISKAKKLLRDHTLKPYQVSEMAGFNNRVYFDNVFKSIVGVTPSEYRKSLR